MTYTQFNVFGDSGVAGYQCLVVDPIKRFEIIQPRVLELPISFSQQVKNGWVDEVWVGSLVGQYNHIYRTMRKLRRREPNVPWMMSLLLRFWTTLQNLHHVSLPPGTRDRADISYFRCNFAVLQPISLRSILIETFRRDGTIIRFSTFLIRPCASAGRFNFLGLISAKLVILFRFAFVVCVYFSLEGFQSIFWCFLSFDNNRISSKIFACLTYSFIKSDQLFSSNMTSLCQNTIFFIRFWSFFSCIFSTFVWWKHETFS